MSTEQCEVCAPARMENILCSQIMSLRHSFSLCYADFKKAEDFVDKRGGFKKQDLP